MRNMVKGEGKHPIAILLVAAAVIAFAAAVAGGIGKF